MLLPDLLHVNTQSLWYTFYMPRTSHISPNADMSSEYVVTIVLMPVSH